MECNPFSVAKIMIIFALCCGFLVTTLHNFKDVISEQTTMSTYVKSYEKLPMPAVTICNKTGFKSSQRNVEWNAYMENTINLTDFLVDSNLSSQNFTIKESLTIFYGRCYTIQSQIEIAKFGTPIIIKFNATYDLIAYVHEPGYELWFIHGYYPEALKPIPIVKGKEGITDFAIEKSIHKKAENCNHDLNYSQYTCLKKEYQDQFRKNKIQCISPWDHSIMDLKMSSNYSCTEQEMMREFKLGSEFFINASENKVEACKGKQKYRALFRVSLQWC